MGSRYAAVHQSSKGPGDARPTAHQIIDDEKLHDKLPGKTILITGCFSGLGVHTAQALYKTGATLYLTARISQKHEPHQVPPWWTARKSTSYTST